MLTNEKLQPGTLSVLNASLGDLVISFTEGDEAAKLRARDLVQDLLKKGYVLFAQDPQGEPKRITRFDPTTREYVVAETKRTMEERFVAEDTAVVAVAPQAGG